MSPPPPARSRRALLLQLTKLSRAKMTVISAVTYLAGALLGTTVAARPFQTLPFLTGWLFVLLTQFMTHFLGEVYDRLSDSLNRYATPITGGSRVLIAPDAPPVALAHIAAYTCALLALLALQLLIPSPARSVGLAMLLLAWAYSAPPPALNHRALGELDAALITSALLPYFAAAVQGVVPPVTPVPWYDPRLAQLVLPPVFAKFALFLVLNLADKRADWAAGKITLPVRYGPRFTALAHTACMLACYTSAILIAVTRAYADPDVRVTELSILLFVLPSAPLGLSVSRTLLTNIPYRLDALLPPTLFHSTLLVWGIVLHTMLRNISFATLFSFPTAFACVFGYITARNFLRGRSAHGKKEEEPVLPIMDSKLHDERKELRQLGVNTADKAASLDDALSGVYRGSISPSSSNSSDSISSIPKGMYHADVIAMPLQSTYNDIPDSPLSRYDVAIVGAGVAGLVAVATLRKLGLNAIALERRSSPADAETGADLALWPGAIAILKELGVSDHFFEHDCFPLNKVHMCKMDFEKALQLGAGDMSGAATILKTIDMSAVTEGTGASFVLVSRERLMNALRQVVPADVVLYRAEVTDICESEETENVTIAFNQRSFLSDEVIEHSITARVLIGADGARSKLREHVAPGLGGSHAVRFCGEVCYRGVLNFNSLEEDATASQGLREKIMRLFPDKPTDGTMRINYGAGLRSSFGYMSADGDVAYWWVKEQVSTMPDEHGKKPNCTWPEPLKTLHDVTPENAFYMHSIDDSTTLPKWSSNRVVLVGDAAHVVTPNMGQGACLATEDAFVLATHLAKNWHWPDGHVEAFYDFERCRKPFAESVASEARKQLFLGQLTSQPAVMLRELLLQFVPTSVLQNKLKSNNFAVQPYLDSFRELVRSS